MNTKITQWITIGVLGTTTVTFGSLFGVYYQETQSLEGALANSFGGHEVRLIAENNDGTVILDKIYTTERKHETLADLMLDFNNEYKLGEPGDFGRSLDSIKDIETTNEWIEAIWANDSTYWNVRTVNYYTDKSYDHDNDSETPTIAVPFDVEYSVIKELDASENAITESTKKGISSLYLTADELLFTFVRS